MLYFASSFYVFRVFEDELYLLTLTADELELVQEMQAWDAKFALAEQYGLDTQLLTDSQNSAIAELNRKHREEQAAAESEAAEKAREERIRDAHHRAQLFQQMGNDVIQSLSNINQIAGENAAFQKGLAVFDIALNQGVAIAKGVASIKGLTGVDYLVQLASIVTSVTAVFARLSKITKQAKPPKPPRFRTGVTGFAGGQALVGEDGPELVNLGAGSDVIDAQRTRQLGLGITHPQPDLSVAMRPQGGRASLHDTEEHITLLQDIRDGLQAFAGNSSTSTSTAAAGPQVIQAVVSLQQLEEAQEERDEIQRIAFAGSPTQRPVVS